MFFAILQNLFELPVASYRCFDKGYTVKYKVSKFQEMEFKNEVFLLVYERGTSLESITRKEEGTIPP